MVTLASYLLLPEESRVWHITTDLQQQTEGSRRETRFVVGRASLEQALQQTFKKLTHFLDGFDPMKDWDKLERFLVQLQIQESTSPNSFCNEEPISTSDRLQTRLWSARNPSSGDCSLRTPTETEPSESSPPCASSE